VLLLALVFGDADLGDADADGPFSLPAIAAFLGGIGFGGAAVTAVLTDLPGVATVLVALVGGLVVALPLAAGAVRLSAALRDMPTEPTLPSGHLIGAQGVVVSRCPRAAWARSGSPWPDRTRRSWSPAGRAARPPAATAR
jgi:hypothetical protein